MSIKNDLKILVESYGFDEKILKNFFKENLYNLQEFFIGRPVLDNKEEDGLRQIQRVYYLADDDPIKYDKSLEEYDAEGGVLNGQFGGIYVYATTSLNDDDKIYDFELNSMQSEIHSLYDEVINSFNIKFTKVQSTESKKEIVKFLFNLTKKCEKGLIDLHNTIILNGKPKNLIKNVLKIEYELAYKLIYYYRELTQLLFKKYSHYLDNDVIPKTNEFWDKSFVLNKKINNRNIELVLEVLKKGNFISRGVLEAQFYEVFHGTPPTPRIIWQHDNILTLKYFISQLVEKQIICKDGNYNKRYWASTRNCFLLKDGSTIKLNSLTCGIKESFKQKNKKSLKIIDNAVKIFINDTNL